MHKSDDQQLWDVARKLSNYLEEDDTRPDERHQDDQLRGYPYQSVVQISQRLDQPDLGHPLLTGSADDWRSDLVLCMIACSDDQNGLPEAACGIIAHDEAVAQLNLTLSRHGLSPIRYHPATDTVELCWEPSDAMGHRYFGLAPLGTDLSYEGRAVPFDVWQVRVNGIVVYPESEVEDTEETTATGMASHSPQMRGPDGLTE